MFQNVRLSWLVQSSGQKEYFLIVIVQIGLQCGLGTIHKYIPVCEDIFFEEFFVTELQDR